MHSTNNHKVIDSILVLQCKTGSKKAVALLVKRWHPRLCKQANWYVRDNDVAKDIAQDSWGVILAKINQLRDVNSFGSWALKIVTRKAMDWLKKNNKERNELKTHYDRTSQNYTTSNHSVIDNNIVTLKKAIKELPLKQQEVLHLFYMEELSIQQISDLLEVSLGTVKSRLFNAREKLKTIIKHRNYEK